MAIATVIYLAAAITDGLDGFIARVWKLQTHLGAFLDPLADKLLVATSFVVLAVKGFIPLWLAMAVISRDVIISLGSLTVYLMKNHLTIKPHPVGKVTTFFQFLYILMILLVATFGFTRGGETLSLADLLFSMEFITGILTIISGFIYILAGFRELED
jgi:cardiolipin synthase